MKKIGVLVVHGIGTQHENFDVKFKEKVFKRLKDMGKNSEDIAYRKVFWSQYINQRQKQYFQDAQNNPTQNLDWRRSRSFVINNLGDASAYQSKHGRSNKNYFNIIRKINGAIKEIKAELNSDDKPLIIIAHSLGGFIISNYIWDAHKINDGHTVDWPSDVTLDGKFEKMVNLTGMITFGCNIPLFVIGVDPIEAIRFPHPDLDDQLKAKAQWKNYYDPDDILGWPLRELRYSFDGISKPQNTFAYPDVVKEDVPIHVGFLFGWGPLSHINYWSDRKLVNPVSEYLNQFL